MVNNFTKINKRTITSHLSSLNTKNTMTYDIGNPGPGEFKPVDGILPYPMLIAYPMAIKT